MDLRQIYHQNDESTMAHLHLGIMAYWLVNTIRYQLKAQKINHGWTELVRIGNTQKLVVTTGQNTYGQVIKIKRCTEPGEDLKSVYEALKNETPPHLKTKICSTQIEVQKK